MGKTFLLLSSLSLPLSSQSISPSFTPCCGKQASLDHGTPLPIPFTLLTENQLMTGMVGGLHNGLLSFFGGGGGGWVRRDEEGGQGCRGLWSFVADVSGLVQLQSSRESKLHLSVNCFSSASDPD